MENHWFSVQAVACTEIISFLYAPSDLDTPELEIRSESASNRAYTEISSFRYTRSGRDPSGPEIRKDLDTDTLYGNQKRP